MVLLKSSLAGSKINQCSNSILDYNLLSKQEQAFASKVKIACLQHA
jgi:hypothetical protein